MPDKKSKTAEEKNRVTSPSHLATVALHALANYRASGLAAKGEKMHLDLAGRLEKVARTNTWEC
jgi:hypothetical protein